MIDVQNGFVTEHSRSVVPVITDLVSRRQAGGGDTVFTRHLNSAGSSFEKLMNWTRLREHPEIDIIDELAPHPAEATAVVDTRIYSLFTRKGKSWFTSADGRTRTSVGWTPRTARGRPSWTPSNET